MNKLLLVDSRVNYQPYVDAKKEDVNYIVFKYFTDTFDSLLQKISQNTYQEIGLIQHANFTSGFNILQKETTGSNNDVPSLQSELASLNPLGSNVPPYTTFDDILNFLCELGKLGVKTFDFLGCELFDPDKTPAIFTYLKEKSGIHLRASSNLTGSNGGD
jgi:hypothetical protein